MIKIKKIFPFLFAFIIFFIGGSDVFAYDFAHWKGASITDFGFRVVDNQWYTRSSNKEFEWLFRPDFPGGNNTLINIYQFGGILYIGDTTIKKGTATVQLALGYDSTYTASQTCSWFDTFNGYSLEYSSNGENWSYFELNSFTCVPQDGFVIIGYNLNIPNDLTFNRFSFGIIDDESIQNRISTLFTAVNIISSEDGTQAIINQNQIIIDQNNTQIQQGQETNDKLDELNQNITNDNVNGVENAFENFEGFIAENSTITQLIIMPITLYSSILNGLQSTCQPFVLGNLFGTNLTLPCINIGNYLGSALWSMIDVIISGFAVYMISKKLIKIFNNFSSMREGDVIDD